MYLPISSYYVIFKEDSSNLMVIGGIFGLNISFTPNMTHMQTVFIFNKGHVTFWHYVIARMQEASYSVKLHIIEAHHNTIGVWLMNI